MANYLQGNCQEDNPFPSPANCTTFYTFLKGIIFSLSSAPEITKGVKKFSSNFLWSLHSLRGISLLGASANLLLYFTDLNILGTFHVWKEKKHLILKWKGGNYYIVPLITSFLYDMILPMFLSTICKTVDWRLVQDEKIRHVPRKNVKKRKCIFILKIYV